MSKIKEIAKLEAAQRKKKLDAQENDAGQKQPPAVVPKRRVAQKNFLGSLTPTGPSRRQLPTGAGEGAVIHANPEKCRPWKYHDRSIGLVDKVAVDELASLIAAHGQKMPALGRYTNGKDDSDGIDIIYGVRRWLASKQLGKSLIVEIRDVADRDALIDMEMENRRLDLSVWERGRSYARWLEVSDFNGARDLAVELKVDHSVISKAIKIGSLPEPLIESLSSLNQLTYRYGAKLCTAWASLSDSQQKRVLDHVKQKAVSLSPDELLMLIASLGPQSSLSKKKVKPKLVSMSEKKDKIVISLLRQPENQELIEKIRKLIESAV